MFHTAYSVGMNKPQLPTPDDLSLPEIMARFPDEESAIAYFETIRWGGSPVCPHCGNAESGTHWRISGQRAGLWQCAPCKKQFRVTVGTIFEASHIPLNKWLIAWYIIAGAKKGISALQMQRHLGLGSYRSAWFLCHRIREAMSEPVFDKPLDGVVEVDETYVGGKRKREKDENGNFTTTGWENKTAVVSLVERDGTKRSFVPERVTAKTLHKTIKENVWPGAKVVTDESRLYPNLGKQVARHYTVNHSEEEYARKEEDGFVAHTNTVESSFSLLKRGVMGSFHSVSAKHLPRYMAEFDFRWNNRKTTDGERTVRGLKKCAGKRLTYKPLVAKKKPLVDEK